MIQPKELRIGNLILLPGDIIFKVNSIDSRGIELQCRVKDNGNALRMPEPGQLSERLMPIPLTEEWLIKLGFELTGSGKVFSDFIFQGSFMVQMHKSTNTFDYGFVDNDETFNNFGNGVHYVHQLQNLYFALTGEELEVKNV